MANLVNYQLRITLSDTRSLTGELLAFDKHMNLVIANCEEFRRLKASRSTNPIGDQRRALGLVILRGETIVSLTIIGPPPTKPEDRLRPMPAGAGIGRPAGRGLPVAPPQPVAPSTLGGPMRGVGGPAPAMMQPFGHPMPPMMPPAFPGRGMPMNAPPPPPPTGFMGRGMPPPGRGQPPQQ